MKKKVSEKAKANFIILNTAIASGASLKKTFKKLNLEMPIKSNVSFVVRDGKFIPNNNFLEPDYDCPSLDVFKKKRK